MAPASFMETESSLTERVYQRLRRDILTGKIPGGTRLVESALAEEMLVSRTPAREALRKLTLEGLVRAVPRAGYLVEDLTDEDIQDLFDTRMDIEQIAARKALQNIGDGELQALEGPLSRGKDLFKRDRLETHRPCGGNLLRPAAAAGQNTQP